jgi:glycosyltransferase involved in cell wall biosynthesis
MHSIQQDWSKSMTTENTGKINNATMKQQSLIHSPRLGQLKDLTSLDPKSFIAHIINHAETVRSSENTRLTLETAVRSFARKRWIDYCQYQVRESLLESPATHKLELPLDRISAVTACMNRNSHLVETLPTWLESGRFSEIIIVDYGSREPVEETLAKHGLIHSKVKIIRVDASHWYLAEAFNIGLQEAKEPFILKLDSDTILRGNCPNSLCLNLKQFKTGNWKTFENNYLNGVVLAPSEAIRKVGGYNEQIHRYGWDDCDFYERLSGLSLIKSDLIESEFEGIDHADEARLADGDTIAQANETNRLIQGNRILTNLLPKWTDKLTRDYCFGKLEDTEREYLDKLTDLSYRVSAVQDKYLYGWDQSYNYTSMLKELHDELTAISRLSGENEQASTHLQLQNGAEATSQRVKATRKLVLMTTLYEDKSEIRQREIVQCLRKNVHFFDLVIILYEPPAPANNRKPIVRDAITKLVNEKQTDSSIADIEVVEISGRPAYRDFFSISTERSVGLESPWFIIANSDIAFDHSINLLLSIADPEKYLLCLSRWDRVDPNHNPGPHLTSYQDEFENPWALIECEVNGTKVPNYLSADAWIYTRPPEQFDEYDYALGTYFCDSFFANRAFTGSHIVVNPCLSIRCFHFHDYNNNSSAEKFTNKDQINAIYIKEHERLNWVDPVAGVPWSGLREFEDQSYCTSPYRWNNTACLLDLRGMHDAISILLLVEASLKSTENSGEAIFMTVGDHADYSELTKTVQAFANWLNNPRIHLVCIPVIKDANTPGTDINSYNQINDLLSQSADWTQMAELLFKIFSENPAAKLSDKSYDILYRTYHAYDLFCKQFLRITESKAWILEREWEAEQISRICSTQKSSSSTQPRFTLFASLFKAKRFLPRLLENFEAIISLAPCELVLIDVTPDNSDQDIVQAHINSFENGKAINYHHLDSDPGIYPCWMQAIKLAQSELVSNFNADDRRSSIHPHVLAEYMNLHPEVDVCFSALKPTYVANRSWHEQTENEVWFNWYEEGKKFGLDEFVVQRDGVYLSQNVAHCMPMWNRRLHDQLGPIREDLYGSSADWAFWLECLKNNKVLSLACNKPTGLYYINPNSHNRRNDTSGSLENLIIKNYFGVEQSEFVQQ